ncbi:MAG: FtsX-like permease family protein, partial [Vicinamibacterales bacterium]
MADDQAQLFVAFGIVALFIATVGVYGVTSYGVSRRRREMNIRVALGAQTSQVLRLVVGQSSRPVVAGTVAGVMGALAIGGVVASLLFDVRARDPLILVGVAALVGGIGLMTALLAARS